MMLCRVLFEVIAVEKPKGNNLVTNFKKTVMNYFTVKAERWLRVGLRGTVNAAQDRSGDGNHHMKVQETSDHSVHFTLASTTFFPTSNTPDCMLVSRLFQTVCQCFMSTTPQCRNTALESRNLHPQAHTVRAASSWFRWMILAQSTRLQAW